MKRSGFIFPLLFISLAMMSLSACRPSLRQHTAAALDDIESYIIERPDSALTVLQNLDSSVLSTRALQARYSLLRTMAVDKCYEDITIPGMLDPAVAWYNRHGSADEKLKSRFYQGRIAQAQRKQTEAAVFFAQAEQFVAEAKDSHAIGLLYEAMATVYNTVHNTDKEQEYVEKSLSVYKEAHDPIYESALGNLAMVYHTRRDWAKADSLYREAIAHSEAYPHALALYLSNYARMKVLQTDKDPAGTISMLNQKQRLSGSLSRQEAGAYAYALLLMGKRKEANVILDQLEQAMTSSSAEAASWISRCAYLTEDYKKAFDSYNLARYWEESEIRSIYSDSVSIAISDYQEKVFRQKRSHYQIVLWALTACLLFLSLLMTAVLLRKRKLEADRSRFLELCSSLEQDVEEHESQAAHLRDLLDNIRETVRQERILRFRQAGRLRASIWRLEHRGAPGWFREDADMVAIREELSYVYDIDDSGEKLVRRLDLELDGLIKPLVERLNLQDKPEEQLFLCCCLLDLPADVVASRFGWTANHARVKKYRLRDQIAKLNSEEYDALFAIRR